LFEHSIPNSVVVSGTLLRERYLHIAIEDCKASNGWITSFKQQHGVVYKTVLGECRSVGSSTVEVRRKEQLLKIIYGYEPRRLELEFYVKLW
jgi:hypothetical protein